MEDLPQTSAGPSRWVLGVLALTVLLLHVLVLLGAAVPLSVQWSPAQPEPPMQLRLVQPPPPAPVLQPRPAPRRTARPAAVTTPAVEPVAAVPQEAASAPEVLPSSEPVTLAQAEPVQAPASAAQAASTPSAEASAAQQPAPAAPAASASAPRLAEAVPQDTAWPLIPLGALPPSRLLSYQLTGMDKGLTYHASGELRWQHNNTAYELTLTVRAFLLGSRHWRSQGRIEVTGLAPRRFSDSWRNERAAHFDREQQRIVFSSTNTPAPLQTGAQDQVSLYVQLAAAMAGEPERFVPGTRLQVQTATVRDAVPWSMVLQGAETQNINGQDLQVLKWVCQPRNQYEARVEFWVTPQEAWLPVRIRITQTSGSYIDLRWRGTEPLPALPALPVGSDTTAAPRGS